MLGYLEDFHCQMKAYSHSLPSIPKYNDSSTSSLPYARSSFISYDKLSFVHRHFRLSVPFHFEPKFFHQVIVSNDPIAVSNLTSFLNAQFRLKH
jgi:hypothetical protein